MNHKLLNCVAVAALGTALALAAPAFARGGFGGGMGGMRGGGKAAQKLVVHPDSSFVELPRRIPSQEEEASRRPNEPMISNEKGDRF